jgi:hypothetical protein
LAELRRTTNGKLSEKDLEKIIFQGLGKAHESILTKLFDKEVEVDLSNPCLSPDTSKIEGCHL